jgi:hypothetical protein
LVQQVDESAGSAAVGCRISCPRERYCETVDSPEVWYVGYGSNLDENRLDKYLLTGKPLDPTPVGRHAGLN